ncbi:MFS family permease [Nocardioides cavernae]|uniref:MFS family permease n=1 Tax=Nocardioides cavernae TaxID=1921566 RepID=A0A7Y9GZV0_9ACTN|nr:MFS transporter [Nocardioides cavernae]NYE35376.1 MFS family permease [Nocardioides cavernae]
MSSSPTRAWLPWFYGHTFLIQAITFVLRPTAIYRALELDVPAHWLGALGASFAIVPLLLAVPSGHAADRFGERRVMLVGAWLTVAAAAAFVLVGGHVWGLLVASVLLGVAHLGAVVGQQALVANRTDRSRYDTAFGHYTFAASAGQALGPFLIVLLGGRQAIPRTDAIFASVLAMSVVLLLLALLLPRFAQSPQGRAAASDGSVRSLLRRPGTVRALIVSCIVLAAVDISLVYLPVLGSERDIPAGTIGALLACRALASMVSRFFLGRLTAMVGRGRLLTGSVAVSAVGLALVAVPMPTWSLFVVVGIAGLGLGAGQPLTMSWLAESTPPGLRGRAMSLRLTGNRLGQVLVPSAAGLVAASSGAAGVLWLTAGGLVLAGISSRSIPTLPPPPDPRSSA